MKRKGSSLWGWIFLGVIAFAAGEAMWPAYVLALAVVGYLLYHGFTSSSKAAADGPRTSPQARTSRTARNSNGFTVSISLGGATSQRSAQKLTANADELWIPPGQATQACGRTIPDGMVYIGQRLAGSDGYQLEAALIDPKLKVAGPQDVAERRLDYWPTYAGATPAARAAYLDWLASGKQNPEADVGYVFLYFYGLERRALLDARTSAQARSELPAIQSEIRRLLSIYGGNRSFGQYAGSLLDYLEAPNVEADPSAPPPLIRHAPSLGLKVGLAHFAAQRKPLPPDWALAWIHANDTIRLRTAATRCPDEFARIFSKLYQEQFGEGLSLPRNKTKIKRAYHPASPTNRNAAPEQVLDLPDVTVLTAPLKKLAPVVEQATEALASYSRQVGKDPEAAHQADALIQLPVEFWPDAYRKPLETLRDIVQKTGVPIVTPFSKVKEKLPGNWTKVTRALYIRFAESMASIGLGVEPDPRYGGKHPASDDAPVVLFTDPESRRFTNPTPEYAAAALCLHLATVVSAADGTIDQTERALLMHQLESWLHLPTSFRLRLHAHLRLLTAAPPGLNALKKRIESLPMRDRETIGKFLTQVAQADEQVTPDEVKMLEKIFKLLELDVQQLYGRLHDLGPANAPVTVKTGGSGAPEFLIPPKPEPPKPGGIDLDMERLKALHTESEQISHILGNIFTDEVPTTEPSPDEPLETDEGETPDDVEHNETLLGLDAFHAEFVRLLITRDTWDRAELEEIADDRGIMLDGALERINEAALDLYDDVLIEDADPVEINADIARELSQ